MESPSLTSWPRIRGRWSSRLACFLICLSTAPLLADDWPQWRGPNRDGRSAETGLAQSWPTDGPPLLWRNKGLGAGYSSLAVVDGTIYTMGDLDETQHVIAVHVKDGSEVWKTPVGPAWVDRFLGARSTPTVAGERVYALSTEGLLVALDRGTGKLMWQRDLPKDFSGAVSMTESKNSWKFSESPLVDGDRVVVTPGVSGALLVALDKNTGAEIWRTKVAEGLLGEQGTSGAGYSSVVISEARGTRQYVQFVGRGVVGVDADTGRFLWHYGKVANGVANIATPVIDGDFVFASSGYQTGSALIEVEKKEGAFNAREVYFLPPTTLQNHHGGLILHDGHIFTGTGHNKGFPISVEMTSGDVAWGPIRNEGRDSAAVVYADDRLYFRYQSGLMVLIDASSESYEEHGSFQIPDVEQYSWSQPVISGGRLYLREQGHLFSYDIREAVKPAAPRQPSAGGGQTDF